MATKTGLLLAAALFLTACAPPGDAGTSTSPRDSTVVSLGAPRPAEPAALDAIAAAADSIEPLNSLLISFRDSLVLEAYYDGMRRDRYVNIKSASKSLLSALVGVALRDSLLEGLHQRVAELLPGYFHDGLDERKDEITLHHLLSMTTGMEGTSFGNYGSWVASRDWVRYQVEQPMVCDPGECMTYSTGNTHLMSAILTRVSGKNTREYFQDALFDEMDIALPAWDRDPQGVFLGGNNMAMRPVDMVKFGELYLDGGAWNGKRLLAEEWIDASWGRYARSRWNGHHYGYYWWSREFGGETVHFAWGYGGQFIFVVPRLEMVVVATSSLDRRGRGGDHNWNVYRFLGEKIFPAFRGKPTEMS